MDQNDLVAIKRFSTQMEAEIARGIIESAGMLCFLFHENDAITRFYAIGHGGILMVRKEDAETISKLLNSAITKQTESEEDS